MANRVADTTRALVGLSHHKLKAHTAHITYCYKGGTLAEPERQRICNTIM